MSVDSGNSKLSQMILRAGQPSAFLVKIFRGYYNSLAVRSTGHPVPHKWKDTIIYIPS